MSQSHSYRLAPIIVFILGAFFIAALYAGSPIDFHADYITDSLRSLRSAQISDLIRRTLNPLTPGWFYPPLGLMEYMRPLQVLAFHISHSILPYSCVPFQIAAAVGFGILSALLFAIIRYWTKSSLWGWLAVILYASFPSNFHIMFTIAPFDLQFWVSIINLITLLIFFKLTLMGSDDKSALRFALAIVIWFSLNWINIKLKSSEKIIPLVCLGFLIIRFPFILKSIGIRKIAALLGAIFLTFILIVPFKPFEYWIKRTSPEISQTHAAQPATAKDQKVFKFKFENGLKRSFFVKQQDARFPFFSFSRSDNPISFSENLWIFLAWFFWIFVIAFPFFSLKRYGFYGLNQNDTGLFVHFTWLIFVWFGFILFGFSSGAHVEDPRFINFAYIPGLILFFLLAHLYGISFKPSGKSVFIAWLLTGAAVLTAISNFTILNAHVLRGLGIQNAVVESELDIFRDFHGREPAGGELYTDHWRLNDRVMMIDWYDLPESWFEILNGKLNSEGVAYFLTNDDGSKRLQAIRDSGLHAKFLGRYSYFDAKPAVFRLYRMLNELRLKLKGQKKVREITVYKISRPNG